MYDILVENVIFANQVNMINWCKDNLNNKIWTYKIIYDHKKHNKIITFFFEDKSDASLFKLTWK